MPAARFWRAVGLQAVGGGALELSALHLYFGGVRVDAAATLTSTIAPASGSLAALQDEDTATTARWLDVSAPGFALVWDFGVGAVQDVAAVRLGAGAAYAEWLETLALQYSADGVVWVTLGSIAAFSWPGAQALQAVPVDGDVYFSSVSLLLHMDGADGSATFTDSSPSPKTVTAYGDAKISTAQGLWGNGSLLLDGTGDALSIPASDALRLDGADFTIEFWIRTSKAIQARDYPRVLAVGDYLTHGGWNLVYLKPSGTLYLDFYANGATSFGLSCSTVADNTWTHVAISRSGSTVRAFIGGVLKNSGTTSAVLNAALNLAVGSESNLATGHFSGNIKDLRITKGVARYTASFTPPDAPFRDEAVGAVAAPPTLRPSTGVPPILLSGGSAGDAAPSLPAEPINLNREDFGNYRIPGPCLVEEKASAANRPLRRRVQLYNQASGRLIRETWSDAATGEYSFDSIRGGDGTTYFVVAFDHTGHHRAVIADNLVPELMQEAA